MEENQLSQNNALSSDEPELTSDNSNENKAEGANKEKEGKSNDSSALILGKFKSADELTKAYQQLEKLQGSQSAELGSLREQIRGMNDIQSVVEKLGIILDKKNTLQEASQKYKEYFDDPSFRNLAKEAYLALGENFDAEKLINLVENYVSARIFAYEKSKTAKTETKEAIGEMQFDKNETKTKTPVKKSIQQMTPKELDALLDEMI